MPVTDLMLEGVKLMLLGMGTVFVFLIVLVGALYGMSRLSTALGGDEEAALADIAPPGTAPGVGGANDELVAAISTAITLYRTRHR